MTLKAAGIFKAISTFPKMLKERKLPSLPIKTPKTLKDPTTKSFNISKFTKIAKIPKAKKVALLKRAIKKVKHVGL